MRLGAFARALEATIDKGLGIDAEKAKDALESAHKEEGSLLDTALGKETAEKVKQKAGEVVSEVKQRAAEVRKKGTVAKSVPAPDDFFDGFLDADLMGKVQGKASTLPPGGVDGAPKSEKASVSVADEMAGLRGGWGNGGDSAVNEDAAESDAFASDAADAADFWSEETTGDPLLSKGVGVTDCMPEVVEVVDSKGTGNEEKAASVKEESVGAEKDRGAGSDDGHGAQEASPRPANGQIVNGTKVARVATPNHEEIMVHGGGVTSDRGGGGGDISLLMHSLAKKEEELRAALDREAEAGSMVEKLRSALQKSGAMLQQVTIENEDKLQELEVQLKGQTDLANRAEKALGEMRRASEQGAAAADQLRDIKEEKEGLYKEGQRLMQEKQGLEAIIKQLRKQLKERDEAMLQLREDEATSKAVIDQLRNQLDEAGLTSKTTEDQMAQIRGMSHETAKKLQERERDKNSLLQKVASLEHEVKALAMERDSAVRRASDVVKDAEEEAKRTVDRERRLMDKDSSLKMEMLSDSLEGVQAAMRRQEQQASAKEARLRADLEDLQQRCAEAEGRCQELSSAVPQSTRPLLRQIESLQAGYNEKQKVWEQVEANLRQRCSEAEAEARAARERERIAQERLKQHTDGTDALQARVSAMQADNSRLTAELRGAREEADAAKRTMQDATAELEVHQAASSRRQKEILDLKALHKRLQMEEADKHSKERGRWEAEREALVQTVQQLESASATLVTSEISLAPRRPTASTHDTPSGGGSGVSGRAGSSDPWDQPSPFLAGVQPWGGGGGPQVASLQARVVSLEKERDTLQEELGYAATFRQRLEGEIVGMQELRRRIGELEGQQEHTLELLGDREEEIDDLRATVEEQRAVFKQALISAVQGGG